MSAAPVLVIHEEPQVIDTATHDIQAETPAKWVPVLWACSIICIGIVACFLLMNSMCCSA